MTAHRTKFRIDEVKFVNGIMGTPLAVAVSIAAGRWGRCVFGDVTRNSDTNEDDGIDDVFAIS